MRIFLLMTFFVCSFSQDGYLPIIIGNNNGSHEETCNQLPILNRAIKRATIYMGDITHPCYCIIYNENNNLQNLKIEIFSYWLDSWNTWKTLELPDWQSLNFSIPHFYIKPHPTFITYKNNQEVSTMNNIFMDFSTYDNFPVNLRCSSVNFPYIATPTSSSTILSTSTTVIDSTTTHFSPKTTEAQNEPSENANLYIIIGAVSSSVFITIAIIIVIIIFIMRKKRNRNLSEKNPLRHDTPDENTDVAGNETGVTYAQIDMDKLIMKPTITERNVNNNDGKSKITYADLVFHSNKDNSGQGNGNKKDFHEDSVSYKPITEDLNADKLDETTDPEYINTVGNHKLGSQSNNENQGIPIYANA